MTIYQVQDACRKTLRSLVEKGELVCNDFTAMAESSYFCERYSYSQYTHLCKQIVEAQ